MKQIFYILTMMIFVLSACNPSGQNSSAGRQADTTNPEKPSDKTLNNIQEVKRLSFKTISEIETEYSTWVEKQDSDVFSPSLHFMYKDTLAVAYSSECWLMYPCKIDNNKMFVYWDNNIDTKYELDIVKTINKINTKYIGRHFMTLELINDTTLKATYPIEEIRKKVNNSSKERTFFPDKYSLVQDGEMYD